MWGWYECLDGGRVRVERESRPGGCGCRLTVTPYRWGRRPRGYAPLFLVAASPPVAAALLYVSPSVHCLWPVFVCLVLMYAMRNIAVVKQETVLLIPNVGLQYSKKFVSGYQSENFVRWEDIRDIIINEVIDSNKIIYVLTVIVDNPSKKRLLLPLFMGTMPRLKCLEIMYQELIEILDKR